VRRNLVNGEATTYYRMTASAAASAEVLSAGASAGAEGTSVVSVTRDNNGDIVKLSLTSASVDGHSGGGDLFVASPPGTLALQPRIVGTRSTSLGAGTFSSDVANLRDVNTTRRGHYTPVSDGAFDVPGSDEGYRIVTTFDAGPDRDVPTRRVLIVARKGTTVYQLAIVVPDAKGDAADADVIARSLELT